MSETNTEAARHNMVVSQIRTWDVFDDRLLELLKQAPRQNFVPAAFRNLAFADMQIPLGDDDVMMAPLVEARLLEELAIKPSDSILEIGTGSGYVTWLLARLGRSVHSIDIKPEFIQRASEKLAAHDATNVKLEIGDGVRGWAHAAPYDVILVTGSLPLLPEELRQQLKVGGRLAVITGSAPVMEAKLITRKTETGFDTRSLFETVVLPLHNAMTPERFTF